MDKILFLDLDGTVSSVRNLILGECFDAVALKMLAKLQNDIQFKIVLSSARRKTIKDIEKWRANLKDVYGVDLILHENWRTVTGHSSRVEDYDSSEDRERWWRAKNKRYKSPLTKESTSTWRGWEIQEWLNEYKEAHGSYPAYAYIDDSRDLYPLDPTKFIHVENGEQTAMGINHYDAVIAIFERQYQQHV